MAIIDLTIDGVTRRIDTDDLSLGFFADLEAFQESQRARDLLPALASLLDIPPETARKLTLRQVQQISAAIAEAAKGNPTTP